MLNTTQIDQVTRALCRAQFSADDANAEEFDNAVRALIFLLLDIEIDDDDLVALAELDQAVFDVVCAFRRDYN